MTRTLPVARLGLTLALAGALAACSGTGTSSTAPSVAPSVAAPSASASASTGASPSASASAAASPSASAPTGSPAARTVQIYAIDGGFQNAPVDPTPGTVLTFRNVGKEAHEMVVVRRNDDAKKSQNFKDLTKVSPTELMKFVTVVGVLAADPGKESTGQIVLQQTGDYAVVDLLATGTTTAPASPDPMAIPTGVPNLAKGMVTTFTVIEPAAS
jgi:plastocyanin